MFDYYPTPGREAKQQGERIYLSLFCRLTQQSLELIKDRPPMMAAAAAASRTTTTTGKRSVCLCVEDNWGTEWYTLDLSGAGDGDHEVTVCPCSRRLRHVTQGSPCLLPRAFLPEEYDGGRFPGWGVLGGNQLYVVGGDIKIPSSFPAASQRLQTVRSLDLSTGKVWVRKPPMLAPRSNPSIVTVGGKLYVLDGVSDLGRHPWGEVYDPESNTWEALPDPPFVPKFGFFYAGLEERKNPEEEEEEDNGGCVIIISVSGGGVVMEYYVGAKCWKMSEMPVNHLPTQLSHGPAIAVGRVVYWYSIYTSYLYGLDLDTHALYSGKLVVDVPDHEKAMLGHLGGQRFFVLHKSYYDSTQDEWFQPAPALPDGTTETSFLHCLKFKVECSSTTTGGGGGGQKLKLKLHIGLESSQSFVIKYVNMDGPLFVGCVSM